MRIITPSFFFPAQLSLTRVMGLRIGGRCEVRSGTKEHAPPKNFEFQKSRMAISCDLRVKFMRRETKNCVIGGK